MSDFNLDNMYCAHIKRGDVLVCETAQDGEFVVLALQDDVLNETLGHVVCVPIKPHEKRGRVHINEVLLDKKATGLNKQGLCSTHDITSVDRRSVIAKKGEIPKELLQKVYEALDITLGRFRD